MDHPSTTRDGLQPGVDWRLRSPPTSAYLRAVRLLPSMKACRCDLRWHRTLASGLNFDD